MDKIDNRAKLCNCMPCCRPNQDHDSFLDSTVIVNNDAKKVVPNIN